MRQLRLAHAVHDEQTRVKLGAQSRIRGIWQRAKVIDDVPTVRKHRSDNFTAPGVDGKQRRIEIRMQHRPLRDERQQPRNFFFHTDRSAIGARTFGTDVDDVRTIQKLLLRLSHRLRRIERAIAAERIIIDVHDAHHQWAAWELDVMLSCVPDHSGHVSGSGTSLRWRFSNRTVVV